MPMKDRTARVPGRVFEESDTKPQDTRMITRDFETPWTLRPYASRKDWEERARYIVEHILICTGLWPLPERTPLRVKFTNRVEVDNEYSVENVYFHSTPGLLVCGNLYRPLRGRQQHLPAVLCPHGHWPDGRLESTELGSIPGRCIGLARRGFVAFSYDMPGYNDSDQIPHRELGGAPVDLWGIGTMGVQLWNSIRAVDFIAQLPDVDAGRIGCTGASGGCTQTFLLSAVDERIRAAACVNMVSASMQGGCHCENQAHLRLGISNIDIAAAMAPRPQLLVSATGDWTVNTPWHEYPAVRAVYRLMKAADRLSTRQVDAPHNYNRESRQHAYRFLSRWLQPERLRTSSRERSFVVQDAQTLRVFGPHRAKPSGLLDESSLVAALIKRQNRGWQALDPANGGSLNRFRRLMGSSLGHALGATYPKAGAVECQDRGRQRRDGFAIEWLLLGSDHGECIPATLLSPDGVGRRAPATLVVHPAGKEALFVGRGKKAPGPWVASLLERGHKVLVMDLFLSGEVAPASAESAYVDEGPRRFFTTYNRSIAAWRVQDLLTALSYLEGRDDVGAKSVVGLGSTGLLCLLAAACADKIDRIYAEIADFDLGDDEAWAEHCLIPGVRSAGDVRTALALLVPTRVYVHTRKGRGFPAAWARRLYRIAGKGANLRVSIGKKPGAQRVVGTLLASSTG